MTRTEDIERAGIALRDELAADEEPRMVAMIRALHIARDEKNTFDRAQRQMIDTLKAYVKSLPDRELWDTEHGVGVAIRDGGGRRWLDFELVTDAQVVNAARAGLLSLNVGAYDGALASSDLRLGDAARQLGPNVKDGAGEQLVLLPEKGRR